MPESSHAAEGLLNKAAEELLNKAEKAALKWRADLETGYTCFLAAQRIDILRFDQARVGAAARSLLEEASGNKIKGWRKDAIVDLVKDLTNGTALAETRCDHGTVSQEQKLPEAQHTEPIALDDKRARLQEATLLRDEDARNTYRKLDTLKQHMLILSTVLSGTLVLLFFMVRWFPLSARIAVPFTEEALGFVAVFGLLGACMSAILSVSRRETKAAIPQQLTQGAVVFARPLFGAAAALVLYLFVQSGLFTAGPVSINVHSTAAVLALSFIAGFSERLIVSVVGTATPKGQDASPPGGRDPAP